MGRTVVGQDGGRNGVNDELTPDQAGPAWAGVDPRAVVVELTNQIAGMVQQLAMRDAYIAQLHQALQVASGTLPAEETRPRPAAGVG